MRDKILPSGQEPMLADSEPKQLIYAGKRLDHFSIL